jgi:Spy/CpxP family protein refolding chaperone
MIDQNQPRPEPPAPAAAPLRRRGRRWAVVATIAVAAALTGAQVSRAVSQHYWQDSNFMGPAFDPLRAEDRADRAVRHLAIEIDASDDQQQKLRGIVKDLLKDLLPLRDRALAMRQRSRVLLTQPVVDRAAIETLRVEQLGLIDGASKRLAQALADAADVLTPEQRRSLDARLAELRQRRGFWQGWHRG